MTDSLELTFKQFDGINLSVTAVYPALKWDVNTKGLILRELISIVLRHSNTLPKVVTCRLFLNRENTAPQTPTLRKWGFPAFHLAVKEILIILMI